MYALAVITTGWVKLAYPQPSRAHELDGEPVSQNRAASDLDGRPRAPQGGVDQRLVQPAGVPHRGDVQTTARRNEWALDKMAIRTEVTKKTAEQGGGAEPGRRVRARPDPGGVPVERRRRRPGGVGAEGDVLRDPVMTIKAVVVEKAERGTRTSAPCTRRSEGSGRRCSPRSSSPSTDRSSGRSAACASSWTSCDLIDGEARRRM